MKALFALVVALVLALPLAAEKPPEPTLMEKAAKSVALLYSQTTEGTLQMRCTATVFDKTSKGYQFVTAAHCVGEDDRGRERAASGENVPFFVTFDETKSVKKFYPATIVLVGYQHRGEDFAVFEVQTAEKWDVVPLGDETTLKAGAPVLNLASPLGLGVQVIHGTISSVYLDRPVVQDDINWKGSMLLSLATVDGGSSGSAVISEDQKAIVGFLVGVIGNNTIVAIPVSRFKAVKKAVDTGKYKYFPPDDAAQ